MPSMGSAEVLGTEQLADAQIEGNTQMDVLCTPVLLSWLSFSFGDMSNLFCMQHWRCRGGTEHKIFAQTSVPLV